MIVFLFKIYRLIIPYFRISSSYSLILRRNSIELLSFSTNKPLHFTEKVGTIKHKDLSLFSHRGFLLKGSYHVKNYNVKTIRNNPSMLRCTFKRSKQGCRRNKKENTLKKPQATQVKPFLSKLKTQKHQRTSSKGYKLCRGIAAKLGGLSNDRAKTFTM